MIKIAPSISYHPISYRKIPGCVRVHQRKNREEQDSAKNSCKKCAYLRNCEESTHSKQNGSGLETVTVKTFLMAKIRCLRQFAETEEGSRVQILLKILAADTAIHFGPFSFCLSTCFLPHRYRYMFY